MRYHPEFRHIPSESDIKRNEEYTSLSFDPNGTIDYEKLKNDIANFGPIRLDYPTLKVLFVLNVEPCKCDYEYCENDVISLSQVSGFTTLTTSIDKEQLLECGSLAGFFFQFLHNPFRFYSSSGEHQLLEGQIQTHLGIVPMDVYRNKISPEEISAKIEPSAKILGDYWQAHTLNTIFTLFFMRRKIASDFGKIELSDQVGKWFETKESFHNVLDDFYDLGFLSGRLVSEYFIREEIEPALTPENSAIPN